MNVLEVAKPPYKTLAKGMPGARIMVIADAPSAEGAKNGDPIGGNSEVELDRLLGIAGIPKTHIRSVSLFNERPAFDDCSAFVKHSKSKDTNFVFCSDGYSVRSDHVRAKEALHDEIAKNAPNVIVACGAAAMWALGFDNHMKIEDWRGFVYTTEIKGKVYKVVATCSLTSIAGQYSNRFIMGHDFRRAMRESVSPDLYQPTYDFILRPSAQQVMSYLTDLRKRLEAGPVNIALDLETRGSFIACCGLATSNTNAICIPFMCVEDRNGYFSSEDEWAIIVQLRGILCHPNAVVIGQNLGYDVQYIFKNWFFLPKVSYDTTYMQHTLFATMRKALDFITTLYVKHPRRWKNEGKTWDLRTPEDVLWNYNCLDCVYTFECWEEMNVLLDKYGLRKQFEFLQSLFDPVTDMMLCGVLIDTVRRDQFSADLSFEIEQRKKYLAQAIGDGFNHGSVKQLKTLFYDELGIKPVINRKTGAASTDEEALKLIARRMPITGPIVERIGELRSLNIFKNTFVEAPLSWDNRMRCSFNVTRPVTYRFSSSESAFGTGTNLQNIPTASSEVAEYVMGQQRVPITELRELFKAKDIEAAEQEKYIFRSGDYYEFKFVYPSVRKLFTPDDGYTIIDMDLDRADLQVVTWEANDQAMKEQLRSGADMHSINAADIGLTRQEAKIFVHMTNYDGKAKTCAEVCNLSVPKATQAQALWFAKHPGIKEWHNRVYRTMMEKQVITNKFGFRCPIFERLNNYLSKALGWIPQSTVAIVINTILRRMWEKLRGTAQLLLQVHDSLVFQVRTDEVKDVLPVVRNLAQVVVPYDDPLIIPVSFKTSTQSWGAAKPWVFA